jgi:very-short-patch-repair endonuclease
MTPQLVPMNLHTYGLLYMADHLGMDRVRFQSKYGEQLNDAVSKMGWSLNGKTSDLEKWTAIALTAYGLFPPVVQQELTVGRFRVDFAVPEISLAIEVDGVHHLIPAMMERDARKTNFLIERGWWVRRIDCTDGHVEPWVIGEQVGRVVTESLHRFAALQGNPLHVSEIEQVHPAQLRLDSMAALHESTWSKVWPR